MTKVLRVPQGTLHVAKPAWWLEVRLHFNPGVYRDNPSRHSFGPLILLNDDLIQPQAGFGSHPHRDIEVFSYVVDGVLSHADSLGNKEALQRGDVQYLSAGAGIQHSEMNDDPVRVCRMLQVWFRPDKPGHTPQYGSCRYTAADRRDRLLHIIGGTGAAPSWPNVHSPTAVRLHQDANAFVSESGRGTRHELPLAPGRQVYVLCIEGELLVNDVALTTRDGAQVVGAPCTLALEAGPAGAHFLLLEMAAQPA